MVEWSWSVIEAMIAYGSGGGSLLFIDQDVFELEWNKSFRQDEGMVECRHFLSIGRTSDDGKTGERKVCRWEENISCQFAVLASFH